MSSLDYAELEKEVEELAKGPWGWQGFKNQSACALSGPEGDVLLATKEANKSEDIEEPKNCIVILGKVKDRQFIAESPEIVRALMDMVVDAEAELMKIKFERGHQHCVSVEEWKKGFRAHCYNPRHSPNYDWHQVALEKVRGE